MLVDLTGRRTPDERLDRWQLTDSCWEPLVTCTEGGLGIVANYRVKRTPYSTALSRSALKQRLATIKPNRACSTNKSLPLRGCDLASSLHMTRWSQRTSKQFNASCTTEF